jgi:hypothetical protein
MSTAFAPVLMISTQSPGVPPFDSTSLMCTLVTGTPPQALGAALVALAVVVNAPVPFGHRPYVVAACAVQL